MGTPKFLINSTSTQENEDEELLAETVLVSLYLSAVLLSTASIIFGVVSWIVIPKWRQFQHYVFVCLLLTNVPDLLINLIFDLPPVMEEFVIVYSRTTFTHWLMIITVMFYIEFVKVFMSLKTIKHIYLRANLFGWLLPFVTVLLTLCGGGEMVRYITYGQLVINFVLYLNVLIALCKPSHVAETGQGFGKRLILSTFAFAVTGNFIWVPLMVLSALNEEIFVTILWPYVITILFINLFFLMLKTHRVLWVEYWVRLKRNKIY